MFTLFQVTDVRFDPTNQLLAIAGENGIKVYDSGDQTNTNSVYLKPRTAGELIHSVRFGTGNDLLYAGTTSGKILTWSKTNVMDTE